MNKISEGMIFGAIIIGVGVGFLMWQKTSQPFLSLAVGAAVAIADLIILLLIARFKK